MTGPAERSRPITPAERDIVSRAFGFPGWRDMVAALTCPTRRRTAATSGSRSARPVSRRRAAIFVIRRQPWTQGPRTRLPSAAAVVAACSQVIVPCGDSEILDAVRDLAALAMHEHTADPREPISPTQVAFEHDELIATLDRLTLAALPVRARRGVPMHTEPLSAVIDRLVTFAVTRAVIDPHTAGVESRQLDTAMADLMVGYDQLITELVTGHRRLPRFQNVPAT
ncbi:hypothetical protein [Nocardia macrotermitis]|uniref:Uncharacterized protein n=1 Tax=Nocardia macrotermitis TaxID=2585198 RepID=A0A7K0D835_9NOCA|nr:hypothetical protein [Nocardia macrotermitis]MQY21711.1 hypothetical protein [Nocardia macrotermitis]